MCVGVNSRKTFCPFLAGRVTRLPNHERSSASISGLKTVSSVPLSTSKTETITDPVVAVSSPASGTKTDSASISLRSALRWILFLLPFAYLWFRLIDNLHVEWETNPQYSYGYLVPLLCVGLIVRRLANFQTPTSHSAFLSSNSHLPSPPTALLSSRSLILLLVFLAFLYLPTRLIEASTPEWRPISWLFGIEAVGLTLLAIERGLGRAWLWQLAFPVLFFFVAIPWPTPIEAPIIQGLTRLSAIIVTEALGWLGIPAMAHGNVIQVATGTVGIDEACSGIRSFQSSIMISLFLGEFYRLGWGRRLLLFVAGFAFSFAFNIFRMGLLTWIAARDGVAAIGKYHDPAGITIAIACTLVLWAFAAILKAKAPMRPTLLTSQPDLPTPNFELRTSIAPLASTGGEGQGEGAPLPSSDAATAAPQSAHPTPNSNLPSAICHLRSAISDLPTSVSASDTWHLALGTRHSVHPFQLSAFGFQRLAVALLLWLVAVEVGVAGWYHHVEAGLQPSPDWTVQFPKSNPTYQDLPIADATSGLLRFDEGHQGAWTDTNGARWSVFYFNWLPGRVAGYLAKRHTPEACLPAVGCKLRSGPQLEMMNIHGVELPVRSYLFQSQNQSLHVYHCRWESGVSSDAYVTHESSRFNLIRGIWNGRGDRGQKIVEIIVTGLDDPVELKAALKHQLEQLIRVQKSATK